MTNKEIVKRYEAGDMVEGSEVGKQLLKFDKAVREGIKDGDLDYLVFLLKKRGFWEE